MSERKAWFCPSCQKHHAPHVETCPAPADAVSNLKMPTSIPFLGDRDPCANCTGLSVCMNAACPRQPRISCASVYRILGDQRIGVSIPANGVATTRAQ